MKNKIIALSKKNTRLHIILKQQLIKKEQIDYQVNKIINAKAFRFWQKIKNVQKTNKIIRILTKLTNRIFPSFLQEYNNLSQVNQQYAAWFRQNYPSVNSQKLQKKLSNKFKNKPLISIITPIYNTPKKLLVECIESVLNQTYQNWELCLADDNSTKKFIRKIIREYASKDKRIKYVFRKKNGHICKCSNSAIKISTGKYLAILDHDDILWPNALFEMVEAINQYPNAQLLYSDEDKLEEDGFTHVEPFFKPDWSPTYLQSINYITHFCLLDKSIVEKVGMFQKGLEGAQDWDLFLKVSHQIQISGDERNKIIHVPKILYSWRKSINSTASEKYVGKIKQYAYTNQIKTLQNHITREGLSGKVNKTKYFGQYHITYNIKNNPKVSIIIPTKNKFRLISQCVESILSKSTYKNYEIILIDNNSQENDVLRYYKKLSVENSNIKILSWNKYFNFASICNFGALHSRGKYLLFLNNDTKVITPNWIEEMLQYAQLKNTGAVGAKLLYSNNSIQHAGIIIGLTGFAGHIFQYQNNSDHSHFPFGKTSWTRNYLAVTAACLMIKRDIYSKMGGMNPKFKICGNDVDLCLRLYEKGYYNVYAAFCELYHYESQSRDVNNIPLKDFQASLQSYRDYLIEGDPFYNPNISYWNCIPQISNNNETNSYGFALNHIKTLKSKNIPTKPWNNIKKKFDNIEISPYQKENLLVTQWYDFTDKDLVNNNSIVQNLDKISIIKSANWFVPEFTSIYAGVNNIFRFIEFLVSKGIKNTVIIDSPNNIDQIKNNIYSTYPSLSNINIIKTSDKNKIKYADISFATLWTTAYHLLKFNNTKRKIYFIQDNETTFYPSGSEQAIVENTYNFGFLGLTNIKILENIYKNKYNNQAITLKSDIDLSRFFSHQTKTLKKPYNVFFYGRPNHPRNGFELGIQALVKLKKMLNDKVNIYSAGANWNPSQFGVDGIIENLGILPLKDLPNFYHDMNAGLFLMFSSHPGVIPFELMASRCPVVINSNNSPGWYDIYRHQKNCIVSQPTSSIMASHLFTVLTNPKLHQQILKGGEATMKKLFQDYELDAEKTLNFIKHPSPSPINVSKATHHL